jgi:hypothetical protein
VASEAAGVLSGVGQRFVGEAAGKRRGRTPLPFLKNEQDSNPRPLEPHSIGSSEKTPANTDKYYLIYFHSFTFELVLWAI